MFSRIQEAIRTLTYREPETGQDAVIMERTPPVSTAAGRAISHILEYVILVYALADVAVRISERLTRLIPNTHSVSLETLAAGVGILLVLILHQVRDDIQEKIRARINLKNVLAPYFGHRLDYTIRVLKG